MNIKYTIAAIAAIFSLTFTAPASATPQIHVKGDVTVVEDDNFEAILDGTEIAWCVDTVTGLACDVGETTWGCQYFPEEGPADDIAVCVLSILAWHCCECLSVCQDDAGEDGGKAADPALLIETIVDVLESTAMSCRWRQLAGDTCNYQCGSGLILATKATCNRTTGGNLWCKVGADGMNVDHGSVAGPCGI